MFQGLRVEAADRSAWKDGLEPSGKNLGSSIQGHMRDLTNNGVSAGKRQEVSGEPGGGHHWEPQKSSRESETVSE